MPITFLNRTLLPSHYVPDPIGDNINNKLRPENNLQVDLATPAFYEQPINKTIANIISDGELPLWNPYQGLGVPLAGQYSTRALFIYQLIENISPYWLWDYFYLLKIIIAGFFTYLYLRKIGVSYYASILGGVFYQFSGSFTWFISLEQFSNVAMLIPIFLFAIENELQNKHLKSRLLTTIVIALILYAGQPETSLYVLLLGFLYALLKLFNHNQLQPINIIQFFITWSLGFFLAAPQILLFLETINYSIHLHPIGGE
ncbi:MAG: hypothetical protein AB1765_01610, partial [Candidatus Hydrogenedentota bacterium]